MLSDEELRAIEDDIAAVQRHIDVSREEFGRAEWWREDAPPIRITKAAANLLAEVKRGRCRACAHGLVDHNLYAGTNYITCTICDAECFEDEVLHV